MKRLFLSVAFFSVIAVLHAQTEANPFAKYGFKKVRAYTSSKGEFEEFHDNKDVVEIGSILFDTKTNQVVGYAKEEAESEITVSTSAMSIDPLCEKYYWISPYAYCLNNPLRFIDPDGKDVWEIDSEGHIVQRIEDKTQDAFYMVAKDADGNFQRTYTTDKEGNKTYNSISFDYGTVASVQEIVNAENVKMTSFNINGDDKATQLFEFMTNPANVEWKQLKVGNVVGSKGLNIVATSHGRSEVTMKTQGYSNSIREEIHNHPSGRDRPSGADLKTRDKIQSRNPNAEFYTYTPRYGYRAYTTLLDVLKFRVRDHDR